MTVPDPEIPVLSVVDLGIIRKIHMEGASVIIEITPTYSGCPAMQVIEESIKNALTENDVFNIYIKTIYSPAWTTDWITEEAKLKLKAYGISPPSRLKKTELLQIEMPTVQCPLCNSNETTVKSEFGSTACKSYYFCNSCHQPFEYFKQL